MNILDQIVLEKKNHVKYLSQKLNKKNNFKSTNSNSFLNAIESNLSKNKNMSYKRNIGVSMFSSELIAFLDSDAYPPKNWLSNGRKLLSNKIFSKIDL